jgi:hypothetical protein
MENKKWLVNIIYFIVALGCVVVLFRFTNVFETHPNNINSNINSNLNVNIVLPVPSEYPDYISIIGSQKDPDIIRLPIAENYNVTYGAIEGNNSTLGSITKSIKVNGKFSRIYLFFEGTIDGRPISAFDDLYFKIKPDFGGHIVIDENSLPVPPGETTKQLYSLESISFFPTIINKREKTKESVNYDLLQYFKDGATLELVSFISSERAPRKIKELSLYYECAKDDKGNIIACSIN